jgi:hypothetical protein
VHAALSRYHTIGGNAELASSHAEQAESNYQRAIAQVERQAGDPERQAAELQRLEREALYLPLDRVEFSLENGRIADARQAFKNHRLKEKLREEAQTPDQLRVSRARQLLILQDEWKPPEHVFEQLQQIALGFQRWSLEDETAATALLMGQLALGSHQVALKEHRTADGLAWLSDASRWLDRAANMADLASDDRLRGFVALAQAGAAARQRKSAKATSFTLKARDRLDRAGDPAARVQGWRQWPLASFPLSRLRHLRADPAST